MHKPGSGHSRGRPRGRAAGYVQCGVVVAAATTAAAEEAVAVVAATATAREYEQNEKTRRGRKAEVSKWEKRER